eukprot:768184-Hanusia_phi.AAC.2
MAMARLRRPYSSETSLFCPLKKASRIGLGMMTCLNRILASFIFGILLNRCDSFCLKSFHAPPTTLLPKSSSEKFIVTSLRGGSDRMELDSFSANPSNVTNTTDVRKIAKIFVKWKLETLEVTVDPDFPAELLKLKLYSLTGVPPEAQHLLGVYAPGANADLRELDIKEGQTLIMYGEPTGDKNAQDFDVEMSTEKTIPEKTHTSTFKSFIENEIVGARWKEQMDDFSLESLLEEGKDTQSSLKMTTQEESDISVTMKDAFRSKLSVPHETPLTLPKELQSKRLQDYTDEDRLLLRNWMNLTRNWRITTKEYSARAEELKRNTTIKMKEEEEWKRSIQVEDELEAKLEPYGLSYKKAKELSKEGMKVLLESDFLTNDETFDKYEHLMDPPALNFDDSPAFKNFTETLRKCALRAWATEMREAVLEEIEQDKLDEERNAIVEREYEENIGKEEIFEDDDSVEDESIDGDLPSDRRLLHEMCVWGWKISARTPIGLENLGNTCYMASALQMFRCIPELLQGICSVESPQESRSHALTKNLIEAMKLLYLELTERKESISPYTMVHHLRNYAPQFAEVGMAGPAQQDAEECLSTILQALLGHLPGNKHNCLVRELFQIGLKKTCRNSDPTIMEEQVTTFNYEIQKKSAISGAELRNPIARNLAEQKALYLKSHPVMQLCVWRPKLTCSGQIWGDGDVDDNERKYACASCIYKVMLVLRWAETEKAEAQAEMAQAERCTCIWTESQGRGKNYPDTLEIRLKLWNFKLQEDDDQYGYGEEMSTEKLTMEDETQANTTANATTSHSDRLEGCSSRPLSSIYELRAVLTHQGRFADSGHYIAWIKTGPCRLKLIAEQVTCQTDAGIMERASPRSALQPMWLKFDDEKISLHPEEEVKRTSGGSEGPIAYLCLYGRSRALAEGLNFDNQRG